MTEKELIESYKENGIVINNIMGIDYQLIFDNSHSQSIFYNLNVYGLDSIVLSAKNRALMGGYITNFIDEPYGVEIRSNPYEFQIVGPLPVVLGFAQRIITK